MSKNATGNHIPEHTDDGDDNGLGQYFIVLGTVEFSGFVLVSLYYGLCHVPFELFHIPFLDDSTENSANVLVYLGSRHDIVHVTWTECKVLDLLWLSWSMLFVHLFFFSLLTFSYTFSFLFYIYVIVYLYFWFCCSILHHQIELHVLSFHRSYHRSIHIILHYIVLYLYAVIHSCIKFKWKWPFYLFHCIWLHFCNTLIN